ncbi:hypothetical protein COCNU_scaffold005887G000010 [Cocos nucifera]|nr:hypothetical protein [Cocos nucifera]
MELLLLDAHFFPQTGSKALPLAPSIEMEIHLEVRLSELCDDGKSTMMGWMWPYYIDAEIHLKIGMLELCDGDKSMVMERR